jgi:hypothetical protein
MVPFCSGRRNTSCSVVVPPTALLAVSSGHLERSISHSEGLAAGGLLGRAVSQ